MSIQSEQNGPFGGEISLETTKTDTGYAVALTTEIRFLDDPAFDNTCLTAGFSLALRRGATILGTAQLMPRPTFATATIKLNIRGAEELSGAWPYITDDGRYCWQHAHCVNCGLQGYSDYNLDWTVDHEPGPAGLSVNICPDCTDDMKNFAAHGAPAKPVHRKVGLRLSNLHTPMSPTP